MNVQKFVQKIEILKHSLAENKNILSIQKSRQITPAIHWPKLFTSAYSHFLSKK
jgi:hypothetical protein